MEKIELKRSEAIALLNAMDMYVKQVGKKANTLAWNCNNMMTYEPNTSFIEEHNLAFAKLQKNLERASKKLANKYASVFLDGEKKGTFILDEKQDFIFTPENQSKLEDELSVLNDEFELAVISFKKEKVSIYIDKVTDIKFEVPVEFKNALELILA